MTRAGDPGGVLESRDLGRWVPAVVLALALGLNGCATSVAHRSTTHHGTVRSKRSAVRPPQRHANQRQANQRRRPTEGRVVQQTAVAPPANISADDCYDKLRAAGVAFEQLDADEAVGVDGPTRLRGPIGGIDVIARNKDPQHAILDCRLALTLLSWSPSLRRAGVTSIEHYSMFRAGARVGGRRRVSGHAHGLAIDAARFGMADGSVLDVLTDWEEREHGAEPCPMRPGEAWPSRVLRTLVCDAVAQNLFQIVITPHHDRAHENHIHFERKPEVDWTYVR